MAFSIAGVKDNYTFTGIGGEVEALLHPVTAFVNRFIFCIFTPGFAIGAVAILALAAHIVSTGVIYARGNGKGFAGEALGRLAGEIDL